VVAAVIERADGSFLLGQRPSGKVYAGWWEFPGGKVEPGERASEALARELHEELGIVVRDAYPWIVRNHAYAHAVVRLNFFRVRRWEGEPAAREHQALRWQRLDRPMAEPMLPANAPVLAALGLPDRLAITAAETLGVGVMLERLAEAFARGLRLVQIRDLGLDPAARAEFAREAVALAHRHGARALVSTDVELARAVGADGVHFPARALRTLAERPPGMLASAACHAAEELALAARLELDFAVLGAVKPTASHPGARTIGWSGFSALALGSAIPVYAIGGLDAGDLEDAWRAGAHGVAMIRGAWGARADADYCEAGPSSAGASSGPGTR